MIYNKCEKNIIITIKIHIIMKANDDFQAIIALIAIVLIVFVLSTAKSCNDEQKQGSAVNKEYIYSDD